MTLRNEIARQCLPVEPRRRASLRTVMVIVAAAVPLVLAACFGGSSQPQAPAPPAPAPAEAQALQPPAQPAPRVSQTNPPPALNEPAPAFEPVLPETLFLQIVEPEDETIVNDPTVVVVGRTTPDAVVSVDEEVAQVNAEGEFAAVVTLDSGPNVIEVVTSDLTGTQESAMLAVIYLP